MNGFKEYINEGKKIKVEVLLYVEGYGLEDEEDCDESEYDSPFSDFTKLAKKYKVKLEDAGKPMQYGDTTAFYVTGEKKNLEKFIPEATGLLDEELVELYSKYGLFV